MIDLSVIIPAFNEENRLPTYLVSIMTYMNCQNLIYEVIVVDDGSNDSTCEIVEGFMQVHQQLRLIRLQGNKGKGFAVKTGVMNASGKMVLFTDADGATPITEIEKLIKAIDSGADIAIASRSLQNDLCIINARTHRKVIGAIFSLIVRALTVKGISDTQCGFKIFSYETAMSIFSLQRIYDFGFDVEILFIGQKKRYTIIEVPVNWNEVKGSKVNLLIDSYLMLTDVIQIRINSLLGLYGSLG